MTSTWRILAMQAIAESVYRDASIGSIVELPKAGTRLENRYVFDSSAREIKTMAERGLLKIVNERRTSDGALLRNKNRQVLDCSVTICVSLGTPARRERG
jgi:hypothetical protein